MSIVNSSKVYGLPPDVQQCKDIQDELRNSLNPKEEREEVRLYEPLIGLLNAMVEKHPNALRRDPE